MRRFTERIKLTGGKRGAAQREESSTAEVAVKHFIMPALREDMPLCSLGPCSRRLEHGTRLVKDSSLRSE